MRQSPEVGSSFPRALRRYGAVGVALMLERQLNGFDPRQPSLSDLLRRSPVPKIVKTYRVFWSPQDEIAAVDFWDLLEPRWYSLIEELIPGFARPRESLAERLKFSAERTGGRLLEISPLWIAEAIVDHCNGRVADLSLGEYLQLLCEDRARRIACSPEVA